MKLIINKEKLDLLLEKEKNSIGNNFRGLEELSISSSIILTLIVSDCKDILFLNKNQLETLLWFISLLLLLIGIVKLIKSRSNKMTSEELSNKICELSEVKQEKRIIIFIKDTFNEYSNKYLLYYDDVWKCNFCLHYPVGTHTDENIKEFIINSLSREMHMKKEKFSDLKYIFKRDSYKYSHRDKENKLYSFLIYILNIDFENDNTYSGEFEIDGKIFSWFSISEMEKDKDMMEKNYDIISYIKEYEYL